MSDRERERDEVAPGGGAEARGAWGPEERIEALQRIAELDQRQESRLLVDLVESLPEDLRADPEVEYLYALALPHLGPGEEALRRMDRVLERAWANRPLVCRVSIGYGHVLLWLGRLDEAAARIRSALALASEIGDVAQAANAANSLGVIADIRCQWDEAIAEFSRALIAYQRIGRPLFVGFAHHNLGMAYRALGLYSAADTQFEHALAIFRPLSRPLTTGTELERALVFHLRGDTELAQAGIRRASAMLGPEENPRIIGEILRIQAIVTKPVDRVAARRYLEESLRNSRDIDNRLLEAEVQEELMVLHREEGNGPEESTARAEMERIYREMGAEARVRRALDRLEAAP